MTTTPFEPTDSPENRIHVEDLNPGVVSEDPDIETPTVPEEEDVVPGAAAPEPTD